MRHKENAKKLFSKDKIANYWNDLYTNTVHCRDYHFVLRLKEVTNLITSIATPETKILDLGCGAGVLTEQLIDRGLCVDSADMSQDMLDLAAQRLSRFPKERVNLFRADCEKLDIPDNSYDIVACIGVFGYIDEVDTAIQEIRRILRPNGKIVVSVRNHENLRVFDIFNWLNLSTFKQLEKRQKLTVTETLPEEEFDYTSAPSNKNFITIFEKPSNLLRIFEENHLIFNRLIGTGYGPPTYKGKPLISETKAIKFSRFFESIVRACRLNRFTGRFADISIYLFSNSK